MNINRVLFKTGTVGLGFAHVVFKSMADATLELEGRLVSKTGYFTPSGERIMLDKEKILLYKESRLQETERIQKQSINKIMSTFSSLKKEDEPVKVTV